MAFSPVFGRRYGLAGFLAVSLLFTMDPLVFAKERIEKLDLDKDGYQETEKTYTNNHLKRSAKDTNKDGKPDVFKEFLQGRDLVLSERDRNFDGKIDQRKLMKWDLVRMVPGQPKIPGYVSLWSEEDEDFDGVIDRYRVKGQKNPEPTRVGKRINEKAGNSQSP